MKKLVPYSSALFLAGFGVLTLFLSTSVILDLFDIRAREGNYVLFVVWSNFISSILYLFAAYGFIRNKKWTTVLLGISTIILITAFTLGHSITLFLNSFQLLSINNRFVEFLIPVTIIISAISNIIKNGKKQKTATFNYALVLFFGLIHGLGFASYFSSLLNKSESILKPLLGFNLGLEAGQIIFISISLLLFAVFINVFKARYQTLNLIISAWIGGYTTFLAIQNYPF